MKEIESLRNREILHKNKLTSYALQILQWACIQKKKYKESFGDIESIKQNQITNTISEIMSDIDVNTMQKLKTISNGFQRKYQSSTDCCYQSFPQSQSTVLYQQDSPTQLRKTSKFTSSIHIDQKGKGEYDIDLTEDPMLNV